MDVEARERGRGLMRFERPESCGRCGRGHWRPPAARCAGARLAACARSHSRRQVSVAAAVMCRSSQWPRRL